MRDSGTDAQHTRAGEGRRRWLRYALMALVPLVLVVAGVWYWLSSRRYVSTDDAYVNADTVDMSAEVSGYIVEVDVIENQAVSPGQLLLRIDPQPYEIALRQAKAQLDSVRQDLETLKETYRQRQAELQAAQETLSFQERELARQRPLAERKADDGDRSRLHPARPAAEPAAPCERRLIGRAPQRRDGRAPNAAAWSPSPCPGAAPARPATAR